MAGHCGSASEVTPSLCQSRGDVQDRSVEPLLRHSVSCDERRVEEQLHIPPSYITQDTGPVQMAKQ